MLRHTNHQLSFLCCPPVSHTQPSHRLLLPPFCVYREAASSNVFIHPSPSDTCQELAMFRRWLRRRRSCRTTFFKSQLRSNCWSVAVKKNPLFLFPWIYLLSLTFSYMFCFNKCLLISDAWIMKVWWDQMFLGFWIPRENVLVKILMFRVWTNCRFENIIHFLNKELFFLPVYFTDFMH